MFASIKRALWEDRNGAPALIRRLVVEHAWPHRWAYLASFALMGIAAGCTSYMAYLLGRAVNQAYSAHDFAVILAVSLLAIAIFTIRGFASYGQAVLMAQIGNKITAVNQQRMFQKLVRESFGYFADRPSSFFMSQVSYGAGAVPSMLALLLTTMGRDGLALAGLAVVMVMQDPMLSLVALLVMPPAVLFVRDLLRRIRRTAVAQFESGAGLLETIQEALQGMRIVKSFGLEDELSRRLKAGTEQALRAGNEFARLSNRAGPMMEALGGCAIALVFLYGGYRVSANDASPGQFVSFVAAFLLAYEPAKRLARIHIDLHAVLPGVRTFFELLDAPQAEPDDDGKPALRVARGGIEFMDVEFAYRAGEPVLRHMTFAAEAGRVTALVGKSGGGKSTVFNLLLRFYEPDKGVIAIDGQDIAGVSRRSLRRQIAYVGQDVFLFRASIRDNIRYGKMSADDNEIIAAAKAANAHEFITAFPRAYDTPVGEHGLALSAGQRQRISIARALLRDAPILLLDEATAALDSESEREIQDAIARLCAGRTTLVIAHRLSTTLDADVIHVIEDGAVIESGRHPELLHRNGRYALFYQLLREKPTSAKLATTARAI